MAELIEVEIAHLLTPVDADEWAADPAGVIAEVLKNRLEMRLDDNDTAAEAQAHLARALDPS